MTNNISSSPSTKFNKIGTALPDLLGQVILEHEGQEIFDAVERLRKGFIQQRQETDPVKLKALISDIEGLDEFAIDRVIHAYRAKNITTNNCGLNLKTQAKLGLTHFLILSKISKMKIKRCLK